MPLFKRILFTTLPTLFVAGSILAAQISVPSATNYGDILRGNVNGNYTAVASSTIYQNASATNPGLLTSTDWTTFNNKQPAGAYLTNYNAFTQPKAGESATTTILNMAGFNTTASSTINGQLNIGGNIIPIVNGTPSLGSQFIGFSTLWLKDSASAFDVGFQVTNTGAAASHNLTFDVGNYDPIITVGAGGIGNPTLGDWFNQSVKTTASPTFANLTVSTTTAGCAALSGTGILYSVGSPCGSGGGGMTNYDAWAHINSNSATSTLLSLTGGLSSTASSTFSSNLGIKGNISASSTAQFAGSTTFQNRLNVSGLLTVMNGINSSSTATSTFAGGISSAGLTSSAGLILTGGALTINGQSFNNLLGTGLSNTAGTLTNSGVISNSCSAGITCSGTNPSTFSIASGAITDSMLASAFIKNYDAFAHQNSNSATSTLMNFAGGLSANASSTFRANLEVKGIISASSSVMVNASSTFNGILNVGGALNLASTFTCTNCVTNSDLTSSTISGVSLGGTLANLTATDSTLTFSGTYNGSTARTIGLALGTANTWTSATTTFQSGIIVSSVNGSLGIGTTTFNGKLVVDGGQAYVGEFRIPSSATPAINWNNGNQQIMIMTANVTAITMTGGYNGANYKLELCQDSTGNRTATGWGAGIIFFVGDQTNATSSPGMTTTPGTCNIMTLNRSGGTSTPVYQGSLFLKGK